MACMAFLEAWSAARSAEVCDRFTATRNTKQKYQLNLTQSLYYQNLDNNAGAIYPAAGRSRGTGKPRGDAGLFLSVGTTLPPKG